MAAPARGALIAVGGGEDKLNEMVVLRHALAQAPPARRVVIVPTASAEPLETARPHQDAFQKLGAASVAVADIRTREDAAKPEHVELVRQADLVYMTGGDQARLSAALAGSPTLAAMRARLRAGAAIAGTSAGAAAMSAVMIAEGEARLRKGNVRLARGLSFLPGVILDTHFAERGRFGRLFEAVATFPELLGVGLGEDTGIVIRRGEIEVVGSGSVVVVDGAEMRGSNVRDVEAGHPVNADRLIVHTLSHGRRFELPGHAPPLRARRR